MSSFVVFFSPLKLKQRMVRVLKKSTDSVQFHSFFMLFPPPLSVSLSLPVIHLSTAPPEKPPRLTAQVIISIYTVIFFLWKRPISF